MPKARFMPNVLCPDCGKEMKFVYEHSTKENYIHCITDGKLYYLAEQKGKACSLYGKKFNIPVIHVELTDYDGRPETRKAHGA